MTDNQKDFLQIKMKSQEQPILDSRFFYNAREAQAELKQINKAEAQAQKDLQSEVLRWSWLDFTN